MPKTVIFLGSSSAARKQAKAVVKTLSGSTLEFLPWWDAFKAGGTLLEQLDEIRGKVQGALLLFSPESTTNIRNTDQKIPNLNVLFELGYFYGHFGKKKVAMLRYGDFYLPSDLGGYIHIFGSKSFKRSGVVEIGKRTTKEFTRWVQDL